MLHCKSAGEVHPDPHGFGRQSSFFTALSDAEAISLRLEML
jgi:hypothetical protein